MRRFVRYIVLSMVVGLWVLRPVTAQSDIQPISLYWFDWSEDGSKIAVAAGDGLTIYDSKFHKLSNRPQPDPGNARSFASFSPDGTLLATEDEIWDAVTLNTLFQLPSAYVLGEWSPDGTLISAVAPDMNGIVIYDTTTGKLIKTIPTGDTAFGYNPLWSPDGTRFAANVIHKELAIINITGSQIASTYPLEDIPGVMAWSPDGTQIAYSGFAEVEPGTPGSILHSGSITGALRNSVYVADASSGQVIHTLTGLPNQAYSLVWSPDGSQLVALFGAKTIFIWNAQNGQLIERFETVGGLIGVDFSPFGGQIMMGFSLYWYDSSTGDPIIPKSLFSHAFLGGAIQKVVPTPSTEKLQSILRLCGVQASLEADLNTLIMDDHLDEFLSRITALDKLQMPPACADDLTAITQAIKAA